MRVYQITVRNKGAAIAIGAMAVVVGGALIAIGLTLFAGLALGGAALGAGALVFRRLTGRPTVRPLDPAQEVFPPAQARPASLGGATGQPASHDGPGARGSTA
jgi:hypothetical protein